ncbi:Sugar transporter [Trichostrongylus colubriformis]|uniref:Sugar transporter n=1 Tax=Trichostrongylus colubriformis TaxID=6319 RepID=A0AAN8ICF7_TRICO
METEKVYETHKSVSLKNILQHNTYRYSFLLVLLCAFAPTCSALNLKLQYLVTWFMRYGMTQSQATSAMMVISMVSVPLCFVSPMFIERCGRRKVFVVITTLCVVEWVGLGLAQLLCDIGVKNLRLPQLLSVFGATMGQCAVNLGLLIMAPIMISEVCPHNTRPTIFQLSQALPAAVGMVEVLIFPELQSCFGAGIFFSLAACCGLLVMTLHKKMVETTGMPVDYIVRRIHCAHSRRNTVVSDQGDYGALRHDSASLVSMHHYFPQQ